MSNFSAISWREQLILDEIMECYVLDQHLYFGFDSASSLKQQSAGKHVVPSGQIIRIRANKSLFLLLNVVSSAEKQHTCISIL
jgi:hypothetical protein